jgi:arylsulfatase A-like enzyme
MMRLVRRVRRRVGRLRGRLPRQRWGPPPAMRSGLQAPAAATPARSGDRPPLVLVVVIDGLRPDSINPSDTPNLDRLRREGVDFAAGHAVFPTATRVNAAAIATGTYPGTNGFVSNSLYVPALDRARPLQGGSHERLLALAEAGGGRVLTAEGLGELLALHGMRLAAVSSASPGSALLLEPRASAGAGGVLVNGRFEPGIRVAYPDEANREILARFGPAPGNGKGGRGQRHEALVDWTVRVLTEYVLADLRPDVAIHWIGEPDHSQHGRGVGSPQALAALRNVDRNLGGILATLERLGIAAATDVFVVSDHGVTRYTSAVSVDQMLVDVGLKAGSHSDDVVVVSNGPCALLYVNQREPARIRKLVEFLQAQEWVGVLFTAAKAATTTAAASPGRGMCDPEGWVGGTFSLELIHQAHPERHPDILLTFPWTSGKNEFGVPGTDLTTIKGAAAGGPTSGHGSMSPWAIRNTLIAWGPSCKRAVVDRVPASVADIVPTILHLKRLGEVPGRDGRVLLEALHDGPDEEQVPVQTRTYLTSSPDGAYQAAIQISEVGQQRYVDKSWRIRPDR